MNSPRPLRTWLLARRQPVEVQLDALRRAALPPEEISWRDFFRELFYPQRTAWSALAAVWLGLALLHFIQKQPPSDPASPRPTAEAAARWLRQNKSHEAFAQINRGP